MNQKTTNQMVSNRQKKKRLFVRALVMTLFMALFTQGAMAQSTTIFMRDGSTTIQRSNPTISFYDSHGPSQTPECWNYWYAHNEDFTYVFKPERTGDLITVSFNLQPCFNNDVSIGNWALRLNDDFLYVYEGVGANDDNLIAAYTGNSQQEFTIMSNGAITFRFVSNSRYREEGWYATVQLVENGTMQPQAPFIRRSTCYNAAELLPTTLGAVMYYTTDGSNPTTSSTAELYRGEIAFPASGSFTVKAASKLDEQSNTWSDVVTHEFTDADRIPVPGEPTITREANSNIVVMTPAAVPTGVNETYVVRYTYTTNGSVPPVPDLSNSTLYNGPITCTTPNTWYAAKTFAVSCQDWVSADSVQLQLTTLYAPTPVIDLDQMVIIAAEGGVTYDILYTLDGSVPNLNSTPVNGIHSATTVSLAGIPYGTTIKALAYKVTNDAIDTNYQPSVVVTMIYVPTDENGNTQNIVNNTLVLIDDREPHTWKYYSDSVTNPIYSMNPVDIKITYSGNGTNNMTPNPTNNNLSNAVANPNALSYYTENATNVHVNIDAPSNQFIYLKTIENDNTDGTGDYTYTTIPNPFQVRPIHQPTKGGAETVVNSSVNVNNDRSETNEFGEVISVKRASLFQDVNSETENGSVNRGTRSELTINEGTNTNNYVPIYGNYADYGMKSQFIIPANSLSAIGNGGTISALKFYSNTSTSQTYCGSSAIVEVGEVSQSSFSSASFVTSGLTTVYSGTTLSRSSDGTMTITFTTPYTYNGGNLLVSIGGYGSNYSSTNWYGVNSSNAGVYGYSSYYYSQGIPSSATDRVSFAPKTTITYTAGTSPYVGVTPTAATIMTGFTTQLTAESINATGATITWSSSNTNVATVVTNSKDTSTATVTGVSAGTATITASITVGGTTYTGSSTITVEDPSYCTPNPTTVDGVGITALSFGSGNYTVNNSNSSGLPSASPYYGDYTSMVGAYMQGETATVSITYSTGNSTVYSYGTIIWVDWNKNYTFEDSEIVYTGTSAQGSGGTPQVLTATFTVPAAQAIGDYRMRIAGADSYFDSYIDGITSANHDPCFTSTYAVCHDYTLRVTTAVEPPAQPVIAVASGTYTEAFTTAITCSTSGAVIYYTTDGSTPSASNGIQISSGDNVTISSSCTLKAVAVKDGAVSAVASATYYINSSGGGSLSCEDFESYSSSANSSYNTAGSLPDGWTWYYQTNYHGNSSYAPHLYTGNLARDGVGIVMTAGYDSYSSSGGGSSTTYVGNSYWLESNIIMEEGATITFNTWVESTSYGTMTYGYFDSDDYWQALGTATTAQYSGATNADGKTSFTVPAAAAGYAFHLRWVYSTTTSGANYSAVIDNVCQEITGAPSAPVFNLAAGEYTGAQTVTITCSTTGATIYYTTDGTTPSATNGQTITSGSSVTITSSCTLQAVAVNEFGASAVTSAAYIISAGASNNADYRGFYAWKVKSLSDGLTITVNGTDYTSSNLGSGVIVYPEEDVVFSTEKAEGNEVEFEALWAQAYYTTSTSAMSTYASNTGRYKNAYERNFHKVSSSIPVLSTYPYTVSTVNPDGTGSVGSITRTSALTCSNDMKLENMNLSMSSYRIDGNGHSLAIGRGVDNGDNNVASAVYGDYTPSASTNDFTLRVESGKYGTLFDFYNDSDNSSVTITTAFKNNMIVGSDYDRANDTHDNLIISGATEVGYNTFSSSSSALVKVMALSGTFGTDAADQEFYMGFEYGNGNRYVRRTLEVFGGKFLGGIAGGIEQGSDINSSDVMLKMRIHGGEVYRYFYGAGQYSAATGSRRTVVTGGDFDCWIAGGCYGTNASGGATNGDINLYFGGDANQTNTGGIYGAGYGNYATGNGYYTVNKSTVVIADDAQVAGSVFGGGNNGYTTDITNVYVLGGEKLNIAGSVYGGANKAQSDKAVTVTMTDGTVGGSLYGGANDSGEVKELATVNVSGGTVTNVYGGGYGQQTKMKQGTKVTVSEGTVTGNIYGGGAEGYVIGNTNVTFSGGTVTDVFGAGQGGNGSDANINGNTIVAVSGGVVNGAVYGGGEEGSVRSETVYDVVPNTETFNNTTAAAYNAGTSYIPTGWQRYRSSTSYAYVPRVSNSSSYEYISNTDGNYLLMSAKRNTYAYAIMPKYENISSVSLKYRLESSSYGSFTVGYVTDNSGYSTFVALASGTDASWTSVSLTEAQINTINSNNGYIAFRYTSSYTGNGYYSAAIDDVVVTYQSTTPYVEEGTVCSTVTVSGGEVKGDVFGGGKMGTTSGATYVNVTGDVDKTIIRQNVFGGALGAHGSVYVGGLKTVNIMGGRIYGSVYGGSHDANDAIALTGYSTTEKAPTSVTNITGGQIDQHVYAAGYYGQSYGSVYGFIGLNAVQNAPHHAASTGLANLEYTKRKLVINGTVWAGGDWGVFNVETGFGDPTVSGNSNIYIDGLGYNTEGNDPNANYYMNIAGSILGSGTSCDAGTKERTLIIRDYGTDIVNTGDDAEVNPYARASRQSASIQRFHNVLFDNAHIGFTGQGKVNSLNNTEKYALYEIDTVVRVANGSTLVMNAPSSQLKCVRSVTCEADSYTVSLKDDSSDFAVVNFDGLGETGGATDNKVRVNGGSYIEVKYAADPDNIASDEKIYGELTGFFHIMSSNDSDDATCAYARPKTSQEPGNGVPNDVTNANDGGFVSYTSRYNQYDANGALTAEGGKVQLRYENHTPNQRNNSEYFRIWRYGGNHHYVEGILNAEATGNEDDGDYMTVSVTVQLPAWTGGGSYYAFERTGTSTHNTLIDYGSDVLTYNAAAYGAVDGNNWMYYQDNDAAHQVTGVGSSNSTIAQNLASGIDDNPNLNYGLVITPGQAMVGKTYIINGDADVFLADSAMFNCGDITQVPTVTFTLTYSNYLSANMTWDPILIPLVQYNENGEITDYVTVALTINTSTNITSGFVTQVFARMNGGTNVYEMATVNVVLPTYQVAENGKESQFTLVKAVFEADERLEWDETQDKYVIATYTQGQDSVFYLPKKTYGSNTTFDVNSFGLTVAAVPNPDNTDDWRFATGEQEGAPGNGSALSFDIGQAGGRSSLTFGITLYFNSNIQVDDQTHMGDVTFTIGFTNYSGGDPDNNYYQEFTVTVEVYRIGSGKNFYVDGIHGQDATGEGRGRYPDLPAKTINYIFNRLGYMPGDNIFVVDNLPISKATTWDGSVFQNDVNVYRYPGGHELSGTNSEFDNSPYLGALVDVTRELNMKGISMDGMYAEATATHHQSSLYPSTCSFDGEADAPMIVIEDGGRVNLTSVTSLKNNYNGNNAVYGGAVNVNYGGILAMNMASSITGNINKEGGGVYVDGAMIVSDSIYVYNNYEATSKAKQNNVYLAPMSSEKYNRDGGFRVVQIGTSAADAYAELLQTTESDYDTKVGITKDDWDNTYEGYMPVVYAEPGTLSYLNEPYNTQNLVVHDGNIYNLERYVTDLHSDSPNYLYWLGTWVTAQYWNPYFESNEATGYTPYMTADQLNNIHTPEQLAWVISLANGENGVDKTDANYVFDNITVTADINMEDNIWVPIGNETDAFTGTFEGNGHYIEGLKSPLNRTNVGMFGATENATISDMVVNARFNGTATNMGAVIGTMTGGTLSNVEGAGILTNNYANGNTGGLVGVNEATTGTAGKIHSSFSANAITGGKNIGGLVAVNNGDLINAYSNATIEGGTTVGGLVAINHGHVENCYNVTKTTYPFAATNDGTITMCYAAEVELAEGEDMVYVGSGTDADSHGTYSPVLGRKAIGYMYSDNKVTLEEGETNANVVDAISYNGGKINKWPGLLSTLNQWVSKNAGYTDWLRPTSSDINGDLPVLCFPKDNCLATTDGRMLQYSPYDATDLSRSNGLDYLLAQYEDKTANIFLYGNAIDVENVPSKDVNVFINEDAVLLQKQSDGRDNTPNFINTTVGISFDNSCKSADDYFGNTLEYDWHLMSTPLADAKLGISYADFTDHNYWPSESDKGQALSVENSYMPNMTRADVNSDWSANWDFYTYYEPYYHWINFKRNINSHHHFDDPHDQIPYQGFEQTASNDEPGYLIKGRGYMMAINQDSYLNQTGTLNNGTVSIPLTVSGELPETDLPSKDWGSNLVGNPYQAYLDLDKVITATGQSEFYIYDADNGVYGPYTTGASINTAIPSKLIHPHQAFFVVTDKDKEEQNAGFKFTYDMATTDKNDGSFFRGGEQPKYPLVNIFVDNEQGNRDLAVIEFNRPELNGVRKVNNLRNANFKVSAYLEGENYGLVFVPEGTQKVPVHFRTTEDGTFTMNWQTMHGTFTSLILVDNLTGTRTDMLRNDHYTFNGSVDDYAARFYITYNVTDVNEINDGGEQFAWFDGNDWIVTGNGELQVVDVTGRVLTSSRASGQTRIHLNGYAAGVYMLRMSGNNTVKTQKIVVK